MRNGRILPLHGCEGNSLACVRDSRIPGRSITGAGGFFAGARRAA
jgi:hypothetical protein